MESSWEERQKEADKLKAEILGRHILSNFFGALAERPEAVRQAPSEGAVDESSRATKKAKRNRQERERKARKKKENQTNTLPSEPHEKLAEPHNLERDPTENPQITIPSSASPLTIQTSTTAPTTGRASRPLMTPAVPFSLQFPKKSSVIMQPVAHDTQRTATERNSHSPELQIRVLTPESSKSAAQITSTDTQDKETAESDMKARTSPAAFPQETQQNISDSAPEEISAFPAQITTVDTEETEVAHAGTEMAGNTSLASPKDQPQNISASPPAESPASPTEVTTTDIEKAETAHAGTEMAEEQSLASTEDQKQTLPASSTAESSESADDPTALASLSLHPAQTESPLSGPSDESSVTHAHPGLLAPAQDAAQAPTQPCLVQFDTYEWPCRNHECRKLTSPFDGSTVICPRCGPYSKIRYCSKKCLFDDVLMHWGVDCGQYTLAQRADPLTIHPRQVSIHPFIPSLTHHDRPERHRQLIRHSVDTTTADYFIFSDWVDWRSDGFPGDWPASKHASGTVLVALNFTPNGSSVSNRNFFTRLVRICFLVGGIRTDMTYYLFKMIRGRLNELGLASEDVKNCLVWQFKHEFAYGGGFAELLEDESAVNWPIVAGQIVQLEAQYRSFLFGGAGLGPEWTNQV